MKKLRSDSKWHHISPAAREKVIHWLFDEGMSYAAALKRAKKEFGIQASITSLSRFYKHVALQRELIAVDLLPPGCNEQVRAAVIKLLGLTALNAGMEYDRPGVGKTFVPLVKLLLQNRESQHKDERLAFELAKLGLQPEKGGKD